MNAAEIQGWMKPEELAWLSEQGKTHRRIVELGSWKGRSTCALADAGALVVAVDTWEGTPGDYATNRDFYPDAERVYNEFLENVAGLDVMPVRTTSILASRIFSPYFDMIFIDADHRYEAVKADILAYRPLLEPGGLLCGHDYRADFPGVMRAVDELLPNAKIGPGSIWSSRV